ncbi:MAG TPA: flagellar motor protein MotB [Pantanalinema sp.]
MANPIGQNKSPFGPKGGGHALKEDESWLLTYADTITNLMALFILMLSVSTINPAAFEQVQSKLKKQFSGKEAPKPIEQIEKQIEKIIQDKHLEKQVEVSRDGKGVVIEFASSAVFQLGQADLQPAIKGAFGQIAREIKAKDYRNYTIEIEGHTDDTPIRTPEFPSNWELSSRRATNVVRFMIDQDVEKQRLKAAGYADIFPKMPNRDAQGRAIAANQAKNRRIVMRLVPGLRTTDVRTIPEPGKQTSAGH